MMLQCFSISQRELFEMPVLGPEACTAETFEIENPEIVERHLAATAETAGQPLVQL